MEAQEEESLGQHLEKRPEPEQAYSRLPPRLQRRRRLPESRSSRLLEHSMPSRTLLLLLLRTDSVPSRQGPRQADVVHRAATELLRVPESITEPSTEDTGVTPEFTQDQALKDTEDQHATECPLECQTPVKDMLMRHRKEYIILKGKFLRPTRQATTTTTTTAGEPRLPSQSIRNSTTTPRSSTSKSHSTRVVQ